MADITTTTLPSQKMSRNKTINQINVSIICCCCCCCFVENKSFFIEQIEERIETRANYRSLISDLYSELILFVLFLHEKKKLFF
jgi:hypothetical protein